MFLCMRDTLCPPIPTEGLGACPSGINLGSRRSPKEFPLDILALYRQSPQGVAQALRILRPVCGQAAAQLLQAFAEARVAWHHLGQAVGVVATVLRLMQIAMRPAIDEHIEEGTHACELRVREIV